jgi:hypothetical protein
MFWDRLIRRLWYTLEASRPNGRDAAATILARAQTLGLLKLPDLHDLSILLLVLICPPGTPLRQLADQEFVNATRRLHLRPVYVRQLLEAAAPGRTEEVVTLGHGGNVSQRGLVHNVLFDLYLPSLGLFLERFYLAAPGTRRNDAVRGLVQALARFYRIPLGTIDFLCYLHGRTLSGLLASGQLPPTLWPLPLPGWLSALDPTEQRFLHCCLLPPLSQTERLLVYLSLYAELDVRQIAGLSRFFPAVTGSQPLTEAQVVGQLLPCWERLLDCIAGAGSTGVPPNSNGP